MNRLIVLFKLLIKLVYINGINKFYFSNGSAVGAFSRILFSSESNKHFNQSISLGKRAGVGRFCELHVWDNNHILIKDHATLNDGCKILGDVTIERYCLLSANIFASSGNHYSMERPSWLIKDQDDLVLSSEVGKSEHSKPIRIEEDCWIGFGVFIKQGIYVGRGAIIGANSVLVNNVPPYSIQVGSPNKELKRRLDFNPPVLISSSVDDHLPYFYRGFCHRREDLELSRKENIIFACADAIAVLKGGSHFKALRISGRMRSSKKDLRLFVTLGKYEWTIDLRTTAFNFMLSVEAAQSIQTDQNRAALDSLKDVLEAYHVICFHVENCTDTEYFWGLSTIEII